MLVWVTEIYIKFDGVAAGYRFKSHLHCKHHHCIDQSLMKTADIMIVGSGSLASGVVHALSQVPKVRAGVLIIGRSADKIARLTLLANARAATFGSSVNFQALQMQTIAALPFSRAVRSLKPRLIFHTASLQSPWESAEHPSAWTKFISSAGFGMTLPLQMALAAEISRGAEDSRAAIINACYPDCVNVALHRCGLRVTCGIGNSAIIEAFCRAHPKAVGRDVRVVAHHGHLSPWLHPKRSVVQPRVWLNNREINSSLLRPSLGSIGEDLNNVTAATAVSVILALLSGETLHMSIPGVAGLPGGYPYALKNRKFSLRLPRGITLDQAIAHNKTGEHADGLDLASSAKFIGNAREALAAAGFPYAEGFDFADWPDVRDNMLLLRDRLRSNRS
jgi:hypothetical protein